MAQEGPIAAATSSLARLALRDPRHRLKVRMWEAMASHIAAPSAVRVKLVEACRVLQAVLASHWFFVLGACVPLVTSQEILPEQLPQVAEYGLATSTQAALSDPDRRAGKRDSGRRTCLRCDHGELDEADRDTAGHHFGAVSLRRPIRGSLPQEVPGSADRA
jgi:hypothetical protein